MGERYDTEYVREKLSVMEDLLNGLLDDAQERQNVSNVAGKGPNSQQTDGSVNEYDLLFLLRLANRIAFHRLEAGHDPDDVLWEVWKLFENAEKALSWGEYEPPGEKITRKEHEKIVEGWQRELEVIVNRNDEEMDRAADYIGRLREACAPSKLAKVDEAWASLLRPLPAMWVSEVNCCRKSTDK